MAYKMIVILLEYAHYALIFHWSMFLCKWNGLKVSFVPTSRIVEWYGVVIVEEQCICDIVVWQDFHGNVLWMLLQENSKMLRSLQWKVAVGFGFKGSFLAYSLFLIFLADMLLWIQW